MKQNVIKEDISWEIMVLISPKLIYAKVDKNNLLRKIFEILENDHFVQEGLKMANINAVTRLNYNDHGVMHSRIVAGSALEMLDILLSRGFTPSSVKAGIGNIDDAKLIVLAGAYLHDIGNAIHRKYHNLHGYILADKVLDKVLPLIYNDRRKVEDIKFEILHAIFSHDEEVNALSLEAGIVKIADGTDMAEGRARIPYKRGKLDIHAFSALAIKTVEVIEGAKRPIEIVVDMENEAGVFQIEEVLGKKIKTSGISKLVKVTALKKGVKLKELYL